MRVTVEGLLTDLQEMQGRKGPILIATLAVQGRFRQELVEAVVGKVNGTEVGSRVQAVADVQLRPATEATGERKARPASLGLYIEEL